MKIYEISLHGYLFIMCMTFSKHVNLFVRNHAYQYKIAWNHYRDVTRELSSTFVLFIAHLTCGYEKISSNYWIWLTENRPVREWGCFLTVLGYEIIQPFLKVYCEIWKSVIECKVKINFCCCLFYLLLKNTDYCEYLTSCVHCTLKNILFERSLVLR